MVQQKLIRDLQGSTMTQNKSKQLINYNFHVVGDYMKDAPANVVEAESYATFKPSRDAFLVIWFFFHAKIFVQWKLSHKSL